MDLSQKIMAGLLAVFLLAALLRIFKAPLKLAFKLLANTFLGFLALYVAGLTAPWTGIALGLNLLNAFYAKLKIKCMISRDIERKIKEMGAIIYINQIHVDIAAAEWYK